MKGKAIPKSRPSPNWQQLYAEAKEERDLLQEELARTRTERDQYLKALYALTREPVDFDKKALLDQVGKAEPFHQFIRQLESPGS